MNAKSGAGVKNVLPVIMEACKEKIERDKRRGIKNRPIRAMVVGIQMLENRHLSMHLPEKPVQNRK